MWREGRRMSDRLERMRHNPAGDWTIYRKRLDDDRVFKFGHCCFLTASMNATNFLTYTGLIGRL
jgi:hypothetical protein